MKHLLTILALAASLSAAAGEGTLITRLKYRDMLIDVFTAKNGARYDVQKENGTMVAENATLEQLRAKSPEAYEFVKTSVALDASNAKGDPKFKVLDGSVQ